MRICPPRHSPSPAGDYSSWNTLTSFIATPSFAFQHIIGKFPSLPRETALRGVSGVFSVAQPAPVIMTNNVSYVSSRKLMYPHGTCASATPLLTPTAITSTQFGSD